MHAVTLRALRTAQRPVSRRACRVIGGVRHPAPRRPFHTSLILRRDPKDDEVAADSESKGQNGNGTPDLMDNGRTTESPAEDEGVSEEELAQLLQKGRLGRIVRRPTRHKQPEGLPPVVLPEWFWENNVKCVGDPTELSGSLAVYGTLAGRASNVKDEKAVDEQKDKPEDTAEDTAVEPAEESKQNSIEINASQEVLDVMDSDFQKRAVEQGLAIVECGLKPTKDAKYTIHIDVYKELLAVITAGLTLRPPKNVDSKDLRRPILILQCPKDGGTYYLDSIVETIATKVDADLVRLDAQDIAQLVGAYSEENLAWAESSTALLAYEASEAAGKLEQFSDDTPVNIEMDVTEEEDPKQHSIQSKFTFLDLKKGMASLRSLLSESRAGPGSKGADNSQRRRLQGRSGSPIQLDFLQVPGGNPRNPVDQWNSLKAQTALDALVGAADSKRASNTDDNPKDLIIQLRDFKEIGETTQGALLIGKLRDVINKRWQDGRNIVLVGTTSTEHGQSVLSRSEIEQLQANDMINYENRTILVPPDSRDEQEFAFENDEKLRIRKLNIRHVEDMIQKLAGGGSEPITVDLEANLDHVETYAAGLEDSVWMFSTVFRIATVMLGSKKNPQNLDGSHFSAAIRLLANSDEVKFDWGAKETKKEDDDVDSAIDEMNETAKAKPSTKDRIQQIKKNCTPHEKKLLGGVIDPADINTTFDSVHAPKETIQGLKMLTTLSLLRPDAFSYGVLATDRIPGLLLYGPPGTGKTLLAKAVAKESGATVLEISGADVNDMYVGEGEKNVKALFSLAKKLSPCIVFIDEADAIFAARGETRRSVSHRELINQFLREWDGMNDMSAFIMVATNRPFDLDEAVLRRLPRRLLVDLPVEKDREAILKIHLKGETMDESVSLPKLAKDTPYYSGSDLKNLSVAAALACIREENDLAAKHTGEEPYVYPEKRTLTKVHFDKALEEISASISEDMSTLSAIRKFDEKYGDRKGRRRKQTALGFGGTTVPEKDSEAGRVRKVEN